MSTTLLPCARTRARNERQSVSNESGVRWAALVDGRCGDVRAAINGIHGALFGESSRAEPLHKIRKETGADAGGKKHWPNTDKSHVAPHSAKVGLVPFEVVDIHLEPLGPLNQNASDGPLSSAIACMCNGEGRLSPESNVCSTGKGLPSCPSPL